MADVFIDSTDAHTIEYYLYKCTETSMLTPARTVQRSSFNPVLQDFVRFVIRVRNHRRTDATRPLSGLVAIQRRTV